MARTKKAPHMVCLCNQVSALEIRKILKAGADCTEEISQLTGASTSCGRCRHEVESIVELYLQTAPFDPQLRIKF